MGLIKITSTHLKPQLILLKKLRIFQILRKELYKLLHPDSKLLL